MLVILLLSTKIKHCMINFSEFLQDYPSKEFSRLLKSHIEQCEKRLLPLDKATMQGGYVSDDAITATILRVTDQANSILVLAGVFFTEIVICCGCGDDPTPSNVYCEICFEINKQTGEAEIQLINR